MKRIMFFLVLFLLPFTAYAEDVYCGDYNGKPAYVDIDSIERSISSTGFWEITDTGIYPEYSHSYSANIYADGLWYKVHFSIERGDAYSVWILDEKKKSTHEPIYTLNFDFAFDTVEEYYPEANRRSEEAAKKRLEEMDQKRIEEAKRKANLKEEQERRFKQDFASAVNLYRHNVKNMLPLVPYVLKKQNSSDYDNIMQDFEVYRRNAEIHKNKAREITAGMPKDNLLKLAAEYELTNDEKFDLLGLSAETNTGAS